MPGYSVSPTLKLQYFTLLKGTRGADIQRLIVMPVSALASATALLGYHSAQNHE